MPSSFERQRHRPGERVHHGALLAALAVAVTLAAPFDAAAQRIASPYRFVERKQDIGPFASYLSTDRGRGNLGPDSGLLYGLRYVLRLNEPLRFSAFAAVFPAQRDVIDPTGENAPNVVGTADLDLLLISGQLHLVLTGSRTWHNFAPYVIGGLGIVIELTGDPTCAPESTLPDCQLVVRERFDFGTSFLGTGGLGLMWVPSQRLGLRLQVTDLFWRIRAPGEFFDLGLAPDSDWTNNIELSAGLGFWF